MGPSALVPPERRRAADFFRPEKSIPLDRVRIREPWVQLKAW
jgi:hypothetical protein